MKSKVIVRCCKCGSELLCELPIDEGWLADDSTLNGCCPKCRREKKRYCVESGGWLNSQEWDLKIARKHGAILVPTLTGYVGDEHAALISAWNGERLNEGSRIWVVDQAKKMGISIKNL